MHPPKGIIFRQLRRLMSDCARSHVTYHPFPIVERTLSTRASTKLDSLKNFNMLNFSNYLPCSGPRNNVNICQIIISRSISTSTVLWSGEEDTTKNPADTTTKGSEDEEQSPPNENDQQLASGGNQVELVNPEPTARRGRMKNRGYLMDRTKIIPVEVSMRYLKSAAYKETYGDNLVWVLYRRNFRGQFAPKKTRRTCIRGEQLTTGNACPICRDEYLVLHPANIDLLKQFISPFNGEILSYDKTGLCQVQHEKLLVAVKQAKDLGTITFDVPFRVYDYSEYTKLYDSYKSS